MSNVVEQKEKRDAKQVVTAAAQRIQSAFKDMTLVVVKQLLGKPLEEKDERAVEEFAFAMAESMTMADRKSVV